VSDVVGSQWVGGSREADLHAVLGLLTQRRRQWLAEITETYGPHPWINRLQA
jgi:hypothetical protein